MRMKADAGKVPGIGKMGLVFLSGFPCSLGECAHVENTIRSVLLFSEDMGGYSQPVQLTASQRSRNIFSYQLPGRLLCTQAWLHEID